MNRIALLRRLRPTLLLVPLLLTGCKTTEPTYPVAGDVVLDIGSNDATLKILKSLILYPKKIAKHLGKTQLAKDFLI